MKRRSHTFEAGRARSAGLAAGASLLAMLAASWPAFAMPADAQNPDNKESVEIGRQAAQTYCASCHSMGPTGGTPNAKSPPLRAVAHKYVNGSISSILIIDERVVEHTGRFEI